MTVIITKHREYHARAMKEPNFKTMTSGYNFSYPVLNTIEIGSLFIRGGSIEIQIERMGKAKWSFDKEKSELKIDKSKKELTETHYIDDVEELYIEMSKYFNENASKLEEKNNLIAEKKSDANIGNQNARKTINIEEDNVKQEEKIIINKLPKEFCDYGHWEGGAVKEYFKWVKNNGWWDKLSCTDKEYAERKGL